MLRQRGEVENGMVPVIATLLILVLTLFLIGIFAAAIINITNPDSAHIAGIIISENNGVIELTHFSGDALSAGEYMILVNGIDQTDKFQPVGRDFSPGAKLTWDLGVTQPLSLVSVVYTGEGKSIVIAEKKFSREGTAKANAKFTACVTEGKDATSQVKTGVSGARALPAILADQADVWAVLDSVSGQATVEFMAEESSDMVYSWISSDGHTANTRVASFMYDTAGSYTVRLDIHNTISGEVGTSSMIVAVRDPGVTVMAWIKRDSPVKTGPLVARTTTGGLWLNSVGGGWAIQYYDYPGIEFKLMFDGSSTVYHARSRFVMIPDTWYHAGGIFNQFGTTAAETQRIYVDGVYQASTVNDGNATGKKYLVSPSATIKLNASFDVSSYSEVPFPLSGGEITSIYDVEKLYPR
ncbi:MAG TPA: type IV pilin [Methanocorpusculum sp.]|nr:type IV pilin [Methanocorpusculum sp.]HJJ53205.1 type IV pilin [Methanocorpusculum sp.]